MGRGSSGIDVNTNYQGNGGYAKAASTGISADNMMSNIASLPTKVITGNDETIKVLRHINGKPNASITIYRATIGGSINNGDWVFLDKAHAEKWTKTAFGTPKPGVKVVTKTVKAKDVDWTGKNLEFMYNPKKRKRG